MLTVFLSIYYYYCVVAATTVKMIQYPPGVLPENSEVTFTCLTDEGKPPPSVVWTLDGTKVNYSTDDIIDASFHSYIIESNLTITVNESFDGQEVVCSVDSQQTALYTTVLNVSCE